MKTKTTALALVCLAATALAGCSTDARSEPDAVATAPADTASSNEDSCSRFETLTVTFATKVTGGVEASGRDLAGYREDLLADRSAFDTLALSAEGDVAERMAAVVGEISTTTPCDLALDPRPYSDAVAAVQTACDAEDVPIDPRHHHGRPQRKLGRPPPESGTP